MNAASYYARWVWHRLGVAAVGDRKDQLAMQSLAALSTRYVPWSTTAMRPSAVAAVLNEVVIAGRQRVVELGGGVSTFYLGRLLKQTGGHLWTVEHDEHWVRLLACGLAAEHLDEVVTVVPAPLAPTSHPVDGDGGLWYDERRLAKAVPRDGVELLLVDGPPAYRSAVRHGRYPALPYFATALAPGCAIVLDDLGRRGEQEILQRWEGERRIHFERRYIHGGIAVGYTPGPAGTAGTC